MQHVSCYMKFPHFSPHSCLPVPKGSQEEVEMLHPERERFLGMAAAMLGRAALTYLVKYHNTFTLHAEVWDTARNCQKDSQDIWDGIRRSCQMNRDASTETELTSSRLHANTILQQCHLLELFRPPYVSARDCHQPKRESQSLHFSHNSITCFFRKPSRLALSHGSLASTLTRGANRHLLGPCFFHLTPCSCPGHLPQASSVPAIPLDWVTAHFLQHHHSCFSPQAHPPWHACSHAELAQHISHFH